ncbi:MAG: thioredoxin domain-containing protein [Alphaproteobacteria bacterium]|nr:thioredoxin domain-containing protein [Alphaproteobacteria bacterium]
MLLIAAALAGLEWRPLDAATVAEARKERRLLLLDLEAVWCHWCHVMDATTWQDPGVEKAVRRHFVPVRVDQDARPDLAGRYREHGWPAIVVLDPEDLSDRAIGSGYHDPDALLALLQQARRSRAPAPPPPREPHLLAPDDREALEARLADTWDPADRAWGQGGHRFVAWRNVEHGVLHGDPEAQERARQALDAGRALVDPVWGGVYQYSTHGDWEHPHFEKLLVFDAEIGRVYALAHQRWGRPEDLATARQILLHVTTWLDDPSGGFRTSQDADVVQGEHASAYFALDDAGRRALGVPRVDPSVYAGPTGLAVDALVALWRASGDPVALERALRAGAWLRQPGTPYLADALGAGRGFMALFSATGDRAWLDATTALLDDVRTLAGPSGFVGGPPRPDAPAPVAVPDDDIDLGRLALRVFRATGDDRHRELADLALGHGTAGRLAGRGWHVGAVLSADSERSASPPHVVVVGGPDADALFAATRGLPPTATVERLADGKPGADGTVYPDGPAAFLCADGRCSSPLTDPAEVAARCAW